MWFRGDFSFTGDFLALDTITLVPFEPKLIDFSMMVPEQINWLNSFNADVRQRILPNFQEKGNQLVVEWIMNRTGYIDPYSGIIEEKNEL